MGARVLDLFAGSGALGIEALSRGAAEATFVECNPHVAALLRRNVAGLTQAHVRTTTVEAAAAVLGARAAQFDLVFVDPPYRRALIPATLKLIVQHRLLAPAAQAICAHHGTAQVAPVPAALALQQRRPYGNVAISIYVEGELATAARTPVPAITP